MSEEKTYHFFQCEDKSYSRFDGMLANEIIKSLNLKHAPRSREVEVFRDKIKVCSRSGGEGQEEVYENPEYFKENYPESYKELLENPPKNIKPDEYTLNDGYRDCEYFLYSEPDDDVTYLYFYYSIPPEWRNKVDEIFLINEVDK